MVGAAGIVASTLNNRHARRESRSSQQGDEPTHGSNVPHQLCVGRVGSRATISEGVASRTVPGPPLSALSGSRDNGGGGLLNFSSCHSRPATALSSTNIDRGSNITGSPSGGGGGVGLAGESEIIPEKLSLKEQVKFYVSLTLGIVASVCVFALLFLIPLVVEPSISTLLADFDPESATCVTIDYTFATGLSKCARWSSCREGCTSTPSQCHQIYVSYRKAHKPGYPRIENFTMVDPSDWLDESKWDVSYTQLLINAKGCGYPPKVRCDEYGMTYKQLGRTFPCYYSRANPRLVVTDYNWQDTASPLLIALGLPTSLFTVSISILSFWYCPSCEERGKNKRPCRSRYHTTKAHDDLDDVKRSSKGKDKGKRSTSTNDDKMQSPPQPIVQQPRGKPSNNTNNNNIYHQPRSPSLATISSRDTTVSSVNSMDDGWQSPPSPPPRMNSRMHSSKSNLTTRARKL
ncbi:unnamed protein product [Orchesella dallaii]|uniref:Protein tipE n=1 Tax=Orchesella dallaii TaxID=48710 RepID=A0ABP1RRL0_9HEXA